MAKAVLVMDMPETCGQCKLCAIGCLCLKCSAVFGSEVDTHSKPKWCPLIPEPERKTEDISVSFVSDIRRDDLDRIIEIGKTAGWNACLDALEGK